MKTAEELTDYGMEILQNIKNGKSSDYSWDEGIKRGFTPEELTISLKGLKQAVDEMKSMSDVDKWSPEDGK